MSKQSVEERIKNWSVGQLEKVKALNPALDYGSENVLYVILQVFVSAGLTAILTVTMQILIHYPSVVSSMIYYVWLGIVGLFLTYNFELGLMGLSLLFDDKRY